MDDDKSNGHEFPAPVPTGTDSYYLDRLRDFERRRPGSKPPSYYAEYGNKCLGQFLATKPSLSRRGQRWVEDTLRILQEMMEAERQQDGAAFAALELNEEAFRVFAFGTHSRAYEEAGVFELSAPDLVKIVRTPDARDLLSDQGVKEIVQLVLGQDRGGRGPDGERLGGGPLARLAASTHRTRSVVRRLITRRS